eukprot:scaffold10511_cov129-Isochrysis_galbana.AAC.5
MGGAFSLARSSVASVFEQDRRWRVGREVYNATTAALCLVSCVAAASQHTRRKGRGKGASGSPPHCM